jgi:hypothetical protein
MSQLMRAQVYSRVTSPLHSFSIKSINKRFLASPVLCSQHAVDLMKLAEAGPGISLHSGKVRFGFSNIKSSEKE